MVYVSTSNLNNDRIDKTLFTYASRGINNIELSGGTNYYYGIIDDLKLYANKMNFVCHAYFPPPKNHFVINLASCDEEIYKRSIKHYEECIELLKYLEIKTLSIHSGFFINIKSSELGKKIHLNESYDKNKSIERFCVAYSKLMCSCQLEGISILVENNVLTRDNYEGYGRKNIFMMTDYSTIMELKSYIDFDLLLDLGHLNVSSNALGIDFDDECRRLCPIAKWYHLSENNGIQDQHLPLKPDGKILEMYEKYCIRENDVTLETHGDIKSIINSKNLIENV